MKHPSAFIPENVATALRAGAAVAEQGGRLTQDQLEVIYAHRWFSMFVPKAYGGLEMGLPEVLKIEEGLAWADGGTAWVVTLCSGAGWFAGFLDPSLAAEIFADKKACVAGSGAVSGSANRLGDEYKINGKWKYASGSHHATVFTANCLMLDNGKTRKGNEVRSLLMMAKEVSILPTWNTVGMMATGSNTFEVKHLKVPLNRSFVIDGARVTHPGACFQYPFLQLAETTLAVNLSGMAARFLELCEGFFEKKRGMKPIGSKNIEQLLRKSTKELDTLRRTFHQAVARSWKSCEKKRRVPVSELRAVSSASLALARTSWKLVDELYPYCALTAADTRLEINRVWRNIHTASQHTMFNFKLRE